MNELKEVQWTKDDMIEVNLKEPDDFLKVRETLTRIGVASRKEKKLYQSCHILHKKGQYYIVHFKELFALDGKKANLSENDVQRRNRIIKLLSDWGLVQIVKEDTIKDAADKFYDKNTKDKYIEEVQKAIDGGGLVSEYDNEIGSIEKAVDSGKLESEGTGLFDDVKSWLSDKWKQFKDKIDISKDGPMTFTGMG